MIELWGTDRVVPVVGDLGADRLGVDAAWVDEHRGDIDHFFHLAAIYDMTADDEANETMNVGGTRHALELAEALAGRLLPPGQLGRRRRRVRRPVRRVDVRRGPGPHLAVPPHEVRVREAGPRRGHASRGGSTGRRSWSATARPAPWTRSTAPTTSSPRSRCSATRCRAWLPLVGVDLGDTNVVPVDYVAAAMDHLAHLEGHDGEAFHLVNPEPQPVVEHAQRLLRGRRSPAVRDARRPQLAPAGCSGWSPARCGRSGSRPP